MAATLTPRRLKGGAERGGVSVAHLASWVGALGEEALDGCRVAGRRRARQAALQSAARHGSLERAMMPLGRVPTFERGARVSERTERETTGTRPGQHRPDASMNRRGCSRLPYSAYPLRHRARGGSSASP